MDSSAVNVNVTVDDFDSVLSYAVQSDWETPDPSSPSFNASATPWWMGTFHKTDVVGAVVTFNFTGPSILIYGHSGPSYGSFEVQIDSTSIVATLSAYAASNASTPYLLFGASNLTYATHTFALRNLGKKGSDAGGNTLLFDYLQTTVQVAPAGASISNTTFEEDNPALQYSGKWDTNKSPNFSGGGTSYTNQDKSAVSLSFHGSAVYVLGDKKNDHGLYSVVLDNRTAEIYSGISGCGGAYGQTCEQQQPTLKYFASNLDDSLHTLRIENLAGVNNSFFDLDSIVVTVPSVYAPRQLEGPSSGSSSNTSSLVPSPSSTGTVKDNSGSTLPISNSLLLVTLFLVLFLRSSVFRMNTRIL